jgi:hypothetical protein
MPRNNLLKTVIYTNSLLWRISNNGIAATKTQGPKHDHFRASTSTSGQYLASEKKTIYPPGNKTIIIVEKSHRIDKQLVRRISTNQIGHNKDSNLV